MIIAFKGISYMQPYTDIYSFEARSLEGKMIRLSEFSGRLLLIVNTASQCGFTPQYKELQELYDEFKNKGLEVLGFPCNQFGNQEPGEDQAIKEFCQSNFRITFPVFSKIRVNGKDAHPLYRYLKRKAPGLFGIRRIPWNFTKFLISRDGKVLKRFAPYVPPQKLKPFIRKALIT